MYSQVASSAIQSPLSVHENVYSLFCCSMSKTTCEHSTASLSDSEETKSMLFSLLFVESGAFPQSNAPGRESSVVLRTRSLKRSVVVVAVDVFMLGWMCTYLGGNKSGTGF